jgi:VanZ family protein
MIWLPVIIWYGVIFGLSSIPAHVLNASEPHFLPWSIDAYLFWGHRIAHVIEYGTLGILVLRAYSRRKNRPITLKTVLLLAFFIFLAGCLDEYHQSFVPGRTPELIDALFDAICAGLAMLLYKRQFFPCL